MTDFQTGLLISVVGLLVTFTALCIFIGIILVLQKLFPAKPKVEETGGNTLDVEPISPIETSDTGEDEIAAVLAAVAYLRSQQSGQLGAELFAGPGPYRTSR